MAESTPGRQTASDNMAKLKSALRLQPHPDVVAAFDLAEAALVQAIRDDVHKSFAKPEREGEDALWQQLEREYEKLPKPAEDTP